MDFTIKSGDLLPLLAATLTYSDGSPVVLTGATVTFVLRAQSSGTVTVSAPATITNAGGGGVSYSWATGDTTTPGRYSAEWVVTNAAGKRQTFPTDGYLPVVIEETLSAQGLPSRLVSLSDAKTHLRISADQSNDAQLLAFIDAARVVIEDITGPLIPVSRTELFDGGQTSLVLASRFVVSVDSVFENRALTNYVLTAQPAGSGGAYGYTFDPQTSSLVRRVNGVPTPFPAGIQNVSVTYTAGLSVIPANVRLAALELIRHLWQQGQQSQSPIPGYDAASDPMPSMGYAVPNRVRELLGPHVRFPAVA